VNILDCASGLVGCGALAHSFQTADDTFDTMWLHHLLSRPGVKMGCWLGTNIAP